MNAPLPVGYHIHDFTVFDMTVTVKWNRDGWFIYHGGKLIKRDCDVFSGAFLQDLDRQINEYEKANAEMMAEPV